MTSTKSVLVSVGEMIDLAIGTPEVGVVDFCMLHTVLHCLAQQLGVLGKKVELKDSIQMLMVPRMRANTVEVTEYEITTDELGPSDNKQMKKVDSGAKSVRDSEAPAADTILVVEKLRRGRQSATARDPKTALEGVASPEKLTLVTLSKFNILENTVQNLRRTVYGTLPTNEDILNEVRSQSNINAISDMWTSLNVTSRLEAAEEGINKLSSLMQDLITEFPGLQDSLKERIPEPLEGRPVEGSALVPASQSAAQEYQDRKKAGAQYSSGRGGADFKKKLDRLRADLDNLTNAFYNAFGDTPLAAGAEGTAGATGVEGTARYDGIGGTAGAEGAPGAVGALGAADTAGAVVGTAGATGPAGTVGVAGAPGSAGTSGVGAPGAAGVGVPGAPGIEGAAVAPGAGYSGTAGAPGVTGAAAAGTTGVRDPGTAGALGATGAGSLGAAGVGAPGAAGLEIAGAMGLTETARVSEGADGVKDLDEARYRRKSLIVQLIERISTLEKCLQECCDSIGQNDQSLKAQINSLQDQVEYLSKQVAAITDAGCIPTLRDLPQDMQGLIQLFQTVQNMQEQFQQVRDTALQLAAEKTDRQKNMDALIEQVEALKTFKLDREDMEEAMADKADMRMLASKVSHDRFEQACDDLSKGLEQTLGKLDIQESLWQQALDDIQREIEAKLDKIELKPVRDFFNKKLKQLQENLKKIASLRLETEAAGTKRRLLRDVNCISCDANAVMKMDTDASVPLLKSMAPNLSMKPYLCYELDAIRKAQATSVQQRNMHDWEQIEKTPHKHTPRPRSENDKHLCNRYCGGSHTVTTPAQRVTRLGHFVKQWGPDVIPLSSGLATGDDGRMYKVSTSESAKVGTDTVTAGGEKICTPKLKKADGEKAQKPTAEECRCLEEYLLK